jgi:uncharacterized protein YndB with AHSA1/START domain
MDTAVIVIERIYDTPVSKVWEALTDINKINQWFFKLEDFKAELGFAFSFSGNDDGVKVVHECVITELIPERKLSYSFIYSGYPQKSTVTFALFPEGEKTRLILTHSDLENFAKGSPQYAREKFLGGWTHLTNKLNDFLNQ